jgi:hypothetical protein
MERPSKYIVTGNRLSNTNVSNRPSSTTYREGDTLVVVGGEIEGPSEEFQRFEDLARKLVQVPKGEVDELREDS